MRAVAITLAALVFGSTLAGAATAPRLTSGLRGVVMRSPTKPICGEAEPCEEPAAGVVLRFSKGERLVARVTTGRAGGYSVKLRPGRYVDFHLDTGLQ
jgi:hypothetical protein